MSDRYLCGPRESFDEGLEVLEVQVMACIHTETQLMRFLRGGTVHLYRALGILREQLRVRPRIELNAVSTRAQGIFYHYGIGIHEDTHTHPIGVQLVHNAFEEMQVTARVPTMVGGQLRRIIRHELDLRRMHISHQRHELIRRVALYVQLRRHHRLQLIHIFLADMPLVGTGMHGNALRTEQLTIHCKTLYIRQITATSIAQRCHFVDIYTKLCHSH